MGNMREISIDEFRRVSRGDRVQEGSAHHMA